MLIDLSIVQGHRRLAALAITGVLAVVAVATLRSMSQHQSGSSLEPVVAIHVKVRDVQSALMLSSLPLIAGAVDPSDVRSHWRVMYAPADRGQEFAEAIGAAPNVVEAFVAPDISLPMMREAAAISDQKCPITTPSYETLQGYLGPAPSGIDVAAAWQLGQRGAGVWFADIEGNWNSRHEDLLSERIEHLSGQLIADQGWRSHGTAVLGEVVGRDNGKGVVGIAPDVDRVVTSSIGGDSVANAINRAQLALRPGDVLLIELQGTGPRRKYIPVEYWDDVFDVIAAATKRGVVVIEAAGNGGEDLDRSVYDGKFNRAKRDSGAIMVGAGAPPRRGFRDRERLDFSNYGSRLDVQGWGRKVATLDYGDLQRCSDATDRHYTDEFSGTSSASPIVAGAAILIEGMARNQGRTMLPKEVRELLRSTGTPQMGGSRQPIGPRPDLARAIAKMNEN
jgi:hypothetical protein